MSNNAEDHWGFDHESYPVEDWQHEVQEGNTRLGYHDWVASMLEADEEHDDVMAGLKSTTNTPEIRNLIQEAIESHDSVYGDPVFEHGQWWVINTDGAIWFVVDAVGRPEFTHNLDFEEISHGEID